MNWIEKFVEWMNAPSDPVHVAIIYLALCFVVLWYSRLNLPNWGMDHKHDRNWTKEEYFQHIKEKHPDIWEENFEGEGGIEG